MKSNYCGYIYKVTNKVNGRSYVGQHLSNTYPNLDPKYHGSGKLLNRAYRKYGRDNFEEEILLWCSTKKEMNQKEKELTFEHRAFIEQGGYVLRAGEEKTQVASAATRRKISEHHWMLGKTLSTEHLEKLTASHTGIPKSEETKKKISKANKGNLPWCSGKHLPEEMRRNISKALQNREFSQEWKHKIGQQISERNKGCHWFTDGKTNKFCSECPEGFYRGRRYISIT